MTAKDITKKDEAAAVPVAIPATGVDASVVVAAVSDSKITPGRKMRGDPARRGGHGSGPAGARGGRTGGRDGAPRERVKPEFDSKIIDIRRVTRVTTGGRRMNFSVAVVAGDRKGRVGVGLGKSIDTASAVDKATRDASFYIRTIQSLSMPASRDGNGVELTWII